MKQVILVCLQSVSCLFFCFGNWPNTAQGQGLGAVEPGANLHQPDEPIPLPPEQSATWNPLETKLSAEFVAASSKLFSQGLADPRGCEYREIEVLVRDFEPPWSDKTVKTRGWVVPDKKTRGRGFGVCWDGVVHPLVLVGELADVAADAAAAARAGVFDSGWFCQPSEERSVSHSSPLPIKACLLLRLGKAELAESVWRNWSNQAQGEWDEEMVDGKLVSKAKDRSRYLKNPYPILANLWTLSLFDQALSAHMRGDDRAALASINRLMVVWPDIEAEAAKCGFSRSSTKKVQRGDPYLRLDVHWARQLWNDQRRRAEDCQTRGAPPVLFADYPSEERFSREVYRRVSHCADKKQRVALLLRELEEATAETTFSYTGDGRFIGGDFFTSLTVEQGADAVQPLLDCLEHDQRLTRLQSSAERFPLRVTDFIEPALEAILQVPFEDSPWDDSTTHQDKTEVSPARIAMVREFWNRYKNMPPPERWYRILADDNAQPGQWLAAAELIVRPAIQRMNSVWGQRQPVERDRSKMQGSDLWSKVSPSVADLMAKRVDSMNETYYSFPAKFEQRRTSLEKRIAELQVKLEKLDSRQEEFNQQPRTPAKPGNAPSNKQSKTAPKEIEIVADQRGTIEKQIERLSSQLDDLEQQGPKPDWVPSATKIAIYLAQWDPKAALSILRKQTEFYRRIAAEMAEGNPQYVSRPPVDLILARVDLGDRQALDEYSQMVREQLRLRADPARQWIYRESGSTRPEISWETESLEPLYRCAKCPAIAEVAEQLFNGENVLYNPLIRLPKAAGEVNVSEPESFDGSFSEPGFPWTELRGPLLVSPAFRKQVLRLLNNKTQVGVWQAADEAEEHVSATTNARLQVDPLRPPHGTKVPYRVCDLYAHNLRGLQGSPNCQLYWPEKDRDGAVAACIDWLQRYGHRFQLRDQTVDAEGLPVVSPYRGSIFGIPPWFLAFHRFERPAGLEDLAKGEAIFSLQGQGDVRVPKISTLPRTAVWTGSNDSPVLSPVWDKAKDGWDWEHATIDCSQRGIVWQVEEVQVGSQRKRYYGFVSRYGLAKVPADEIKFDLPESVGDFWDESIRVDDHLYVDLSTAPGAELRDCVKRTPDADEFPAMLFYRAGQSLVFKVQAFNCWGLDCRMPLVVEEVPGKKAGSAAIPMSLCLEYLPGIPEREANLNINSMYYVDETPWTRLPRKAGEPLTMRQPPSEMTPAELVDCFQLDLNRLFDASRPGTYRLTIKLKCGAKGEWQERQIIFAVTNRDSA